MYAWMWRQLPFGLRGKIAGSVLLVAGIGVLLWYVIFPVVEPKMPFNDGQIEDGGGSVPTSQQSTTGQEVPSPGASGAPGGQSSTPSSTPR